MIYSVFHKKDVRSKIIQLFFILPGMFIVACNMQKVENPIDVAKNYCTCIEEEMKRNNDSLINIYDCEKSEFSKSRFMKIYLSFDEYDKYNASTIDSARKFSHDLARIIDTMCLNKIDPKRIKKLLHIPM